MTTPTIAAAKTLDGRIVAMLTSDELQVLDFYIARGRKFGLKVRIINMADPVRLAAAGSRQEANAILKFANSTVSVALAGQIEKGTQ